MRSDRSLAERFRAGDEAAFATLYDRYRARVNAICIGVLGSREDALDATQEVFTTVAVKLREEPPRELRPWLATVARNAAVDLARKRRPTVEADEETAVVRPAHSEFELQELVSALRELPEQQRTALVMRELGGWSYDEIGASLGVDGDAVNGLIARARLGLRAQREAAALVCSAVRETIAGEEDGRRRTAPIRRHLKSCDGCREFAGALQSDSQALRALLPGSGLGVLAVIAALRPRPALIGGLGALKMAVSGASAPVIAVCAIGAACTVGGLSAFDALPPVPEQLATEKKGPPSQPSGGGTSEAAAVPTSVAVEVATDGSAPASGADDAADQGAERHATSIAQPGPEGRVPADYPERFDPTREPAGRGPRHGGPAPFDFDGDNDSGEGRRGPRRPAPGGDDLSGDGSPRHEGSSGPRGDREPRHDDGTRSGDGTRDDGPRDGDGTRDGSGDREPRHEEGDRPPPPPPEDEPLPDDGGLLPLEPRSGPGPDTLDGDGLDGSRDGDGLRDGSLDGH